MGAGGGRDVGAGLEEDAVVKIEWLDRLDRFCGTL